MKLIEVEMWPAEILGESVYLSIDEHLSNAWETRKLAEIIRVPTTERRTLSLKLRNKTSVRILGSKAVKDEDGKLEKNNENSIFLSQEH